MIDKIILSSGTGNVWVVVHLGRGFLLLIVIVLTKEGNEFLSDLTKRVSREEDGETREQAEGAGLNSHVPSQWSFKTRLVGSNLIHSCVECSPDVSSLDESEDGAKECPEEEEHDDNEFKHCNAVGPVRPLGVVFV